MSWLVISSEIVNEEKGLSGKLKVVFSFDKGFESRVVCMLFKKAKMCPLNKTPLTASLSHPNSTVMEELKRLASLRVWKVSVT